MREATEVELAWIKAGCVLKGRRDFIDALLAGGEQWCTWHQMIEPVSEFGKCSNRRSGLQGFCRASNAPYQLQGRQRNPELQLLRAARAADKRCGREFNLTIEDIVIPDTCPVLGIRIIPNNGNKLRNDNSPSLERYDNTKGHVKGNCEVVSWRANDIHGDSTVEEMEAVVKFLKEKMK